MPILLAEKVIQLEFSDLLNRRPIDRDRVITRAPGWHQSAILADIARKIGVLKPGEKDESEYPLIWALGNAVEEYVFSFYVDKGMIWQPGQVTVGKISMSPDGLTPDADMDAIVGRPGAGLGRRHLMEECKATYKSVATGEEFVSDKKWWMWRQQAAFYLHGYGLTTERWHVWHLRGDYKKFGPVYKQYVVEFTERECRQTFDMLDRHKDGVEQEVGS